MGGSQQMEQTYLATHGNSSRNTTVQVDGMMINGVMNDGQIQAYTDNALVQEATTRPAVSPLKCRRAACVST